MHKLSNNSGQDMRVWITGANGQLGRQLMRQIPIGAVAFSPDRLQVDMLNLSAAMPLIDRFSPTHIINAAAFNNVDQAQLDTRAAWSLNHIAVRQLAEIANQHAARLVHISTDFVFDGTATEPYLPTSATNPISEYGKSKEAGEHAALTVCSNSIVIRTASLYALNGRNFVNSVLAGLALHKSIEVVNDQTSSPTHAASLAQCVWRFAPRSETGVWHFTDAGSVNKFSFAQAIADEAFESGLLSSQKQVVAIKPGSLVTKAIRPSFSVLNKDATWSIVGTPPEWRDQLRKYLCTLTRPTDA